MNDHELFGDVPHSDRPQLLGRPRLEPDQRRTRQLRLFLNDAEELKLRNDAAEVGMSRHNYVRALIAGHKPTIRGGKHYDPRLLHELNAVGNNLNQAVRDMNAGSTRRHDWEQLRKLLQEILLNVAFAGESDVH